MTKAWTEIAIKRKKFEGKRKTHTIPNTGGLSFSVREDGTYYEWRMMRCGENYKVHIGSVYEFSLEEAKNQAHQYRQNVKLGLPPQFDSLNQSALSFQDAYDEYISSREFNDLKLSYRKTFIFRMEKYVVLTKNSTSTRDELRKAQVELKKNKLADVSLSSITEIVARQMWSKIKSAESANVAKAIKSHCKIIVDWNMEHNGVVLETNPFNFSVPRTNQKKREKFFTDTEIGKLISEFKEQASPKRQFFNCALLTGWRNGEITKMRWDEIEYGVKVPNSNQVIAIWNSPSESNKSNQATRFVLTDRIVRQIDSLPRLGEYVFSHGNKDHGGHDLPMTRPAKTVRKILNKIGLSDEYRLHTLRHTMVTRLKEFDVSAADIDRFLGKSVREGSASHSTYSHSDSILAKLRVAETWESHLVNLGFGGDND